MKGTFLAKVVGAEFGENNGKEMVAVTFEISNGDQVGKKVTWYGYFTDKTAERTVKALRTMGWQGFDLSTMTQFDLTEEVEIVVEEEEYQGKMKTRVQWINSPGGAAPVVKNKLESAAKKALSAKMKGLCMKFKPEPRKAPDRQPGEDFDDELPI